MEILIITLTVTVCTLIISSAIGLKVYDAYEYCRRQEPVGYNLN